VPQRLGPASVQVQDVQVLDRAFAGPEGGQASQGRQGQLLREQAEALGGQQDAGPVGLEVEFENALVFQKQDPVSIPGPDGTEGQRP